MQLLSNLGKAIFPRYCFSCGRYGSYLCQVCRKKFRYDDRCYVCNDKKCGIFRHNSCVGYATGAIVLYQYRDAIKKLLQGGKYLGLYLVYDFVGRELCARIVDSGMFGMLGEKTIITYVPLYQKKLIRGRGYNQGRLIAKSLASHTGIEFAGLFSKNKHTAQQSWLKRGDRIKNLDNVFAIKPPISAYSDIILVDDVITTGSTLETISKLIKSKNQHAKIWYLLIARSD